VGGPLKYQGRNGKNMKNKHLICSNKKIILPTSRIEGHKTLKIDSFIKLFMNFSKSIFFGTHYYSILIGSVVQTTWRVLHLQVEERAPRCR
jgi:hypothetical protein